VPPPPLSCKRLSKGKETCEVWLVPRGCEPNDNANQMTLGSLQKAAAQAGLRPCACQPHVHHARVVYDPFRHVFESQFAQICGQIDFKSQLDFGIRNTILLVAQCKIVIKFRGSHLGPGPISRGMRPRAYRSQIPHTKCPEFEDFIFLSRPRL